MRKELLTGNEAIARGAWEAGIQVAAGYPGTPSTEILENLVRLPEVACQWSPNEKVACEVALGAAVGGAKALATMKHVGVNVAADPLFSAANTGINGGFVLVSADEPGMHSSQGDQDNRLYARFAKIALLEPSDSQECKDMMMLALELSEGFNLPVMLRTTTRISHSKSSVTMGERVATPSKPYQKESRFVTMPANAMINRRDMELRLQALTAYSEETPLNAVEWGDKRIGVITSGICYHHVKEALPQASVLKIGLSNPLPLKKIAAFAAEVDKLYVVEELEPFMEDQLKAAGITCIGKKILPNIGEISPNIIRLALGIPAKEAAAPEIAPPRPPVLCPGCPHRGVFHILSKLDCLVTGDIGCYTLGALPPLSSLDTCFCMGAALPMALGMELAHPELARKIVAVEGDSTFLHSGMTGLLDLVYNGSTALVMILDNSITAMTGHQPNPASGSHLDNSQAPQVNLPNLCKALGVPRVRTVDPYDLKELENAVRQELEATELSVIVVERPCVLLPQVPKGRHSVNPEACRGCTLCTRIGCPALSFSDKKSSIVPELCVGCGVCQQLCNFGAINKEV